MAKKIAYLILDSGVDGCTKPRIMFASFSDIERDEKLDADPAKDWKRKGEVIVDTAIARARALEKLDGLDKLVLELTQ